MERKTWATMGTGKKYRVNEVFDYLLRDCRARRKAAIMRAAAATREGSTAHMLPDKKQRVEADKKACKKNKDAQNPCDGRCGQCQRDV